MRDARAGAGRSTGVFGRDLEALARDRPGGVLRPGDADYETVRANWNLLVDQRPAAIVLPESPEDVAVAVTLAAEHQVPIAIQATGHGAVHPADGAVLLDTRRMSGVEVDPVQRTAWVGAGTRFEDLMRAAERHGLAPASGQAPYLGVVGFSLGGGCGWLVRRYGTGADAVRAARLVTSDAAVRLVDGDRDPQLHWALRGGGGNFGVVTGLQVDLYPAVGVVAGQFYFAAERAREVLRTWRDLTLRAPDELTSQVALLSVTRHVPFMGLPELAYGGEVLAVGACLVVPDGSAWADSRALADELLEPLRMLGPIIDTVGPRPVSSVAAIEANPVGPRSVWSRVDLLAELPDAALETVLVHAGPGTGSPLSSVTFRHLGGAAARGRHGLTPLPHRDARYLMHVVTVSDRRPDEWVRLRTVEVSAAMQRWATGAALPTFLGTGDSGPARVRAAYRAAAFDRLSRMKGDLDPDNLFRFNHNIPVSGSPT